MVTYSPGFGFFVGDSGKQKSVGKQVPTTEPRSMIPSFWKKYRHRDRENPENNNTKNQNKDIQTTQTRPTPPAPPYDNPPNNGNQRVTTRNNKKAYWRRMYPYLTFLAAFSTVMTFLLVWNQATDLRRQAFDANMTKDYIVDVSMDNSELIQYINDFMLKKTTSQDPLNVSQTMEEEIVASILKNKREGVYLEYLSRIGATSTTTWLDSNLGWSGVLVITDPRSSFEAQRSSRNPKTRILHACLSTDRDTKEVTLPQESEVQVTKLVEGPNSLSSIEDNLPPTRIKCFPIYSVLLAYNTTTLDYLSLDGQDIQDLQVLDTIPWDKVKISTIFIHWNSHHSEIEKTNVIEKLSNRRYKHVKPAGMNKLVFHYNRQLKI